MSPLKHCIFCHSYKTIHDYLIHGAKHLHLYQYCRKPAPTLVWPDLAKLLPKALKSCPKSNKLPNLVTLLRTHQVVPGGHLHLADVAREKRRSGLCRGRRRRRMHLRLVCNEARLGEERPVTHVAEVVFLAEVELEMQLKVSFDPESLAARWTLEFFHVGVTCDHQYCKTFCLP